MKDHKTEVAGLFKGDSEGDTPFDEEEDKVGGCVQILAQVYLPTD